MFLLLMGMIAGRENSAAVAASAKRRRVQANTKAYFALHLLNNMECPVDEYGALLPWKMKQDFISTQYNAFVAAAIKSFTTAGLGKATITGGTVGRMLVGTRKVGPGMRGKHMAGFVFTEAATVSKNRKPKKAREQGRVPIRNFLTACELGSMIDPSDTVDRECRPLIAYPDIGTGAMPTVSIVSSLPTDGEHARPSNYSVVEREEVKEILGLDVHHERRQHTTRFPEAGVRHAMTLAHYYMPG